MKTLQSGDPANQDALVLGDSDLCAWRVEQGVIWVQTRNPLHYDRLRKRADCRLVAYSVAGGYLRTFEFQGKTLGWARDLIERYQKPTQAAAGTGVEAIHSAKRGDSEPNLDGGKGKITD